MQTDDLKDFYESKYPRNQEVSPPLRDEDLTFGQILRLLRPQLRPGDRALDVGCNDGNLSLYMARAGCEVVGVDIARNAVEAARRNAAEHGIGNAQFRAMDFATGWDEPEVFDFALCSHVIEHVPDDAAFVARIAFALKPGGRLLLFTPCVYSSTYWLGKLIPLQALWVQGEEIGHLRHYSRLGLRKLLEDCGLVVQHGGCLDGIARDWLWHCRPMRRALRLIRTRPVRRAFNLVDAALARVLFPYTLWALARKPERPRPGGQP